MMTAPYFVASKYLMPSPESVCVRSFVRFLFVPAIYSVFFCLALSFQLWKILLTERLDEGLMVLRRLMRWDLIDVTYVSLYKTTAGSRRYDGKVLADVPHFDDLRPQVNLSDIPLLLGDEGFSPTRLPTKSIVEHTLCLVETLTVAIDITITLTHRCQAVGLPLTRDVPRILGQGRC